MLSTTLSDLRSLPDEDLDALRVSILSEQERRAKLAALPTDLTALARAAIDAGCTPDSLRASLDAAIQN